MYDGDVTEPLPIVHPASARLYADLLLIQRMLQIIRPKYREARAAFYGALLDMDTAKQRLVMIEQRMDALVTQRERLNQAHLQAVREEARRANPEPSPGETDDDRWKRWEAEWRED